MTQESKDNIFDTARKKAMDKGKETPSPPPAPIKTTGETETVEEMLSKIAAMRDDLRKKMDILVEKSGVSRQEIVNYCSNPNNFSTQKWEQMERKRRDFEAKVWAALGKSVEGAKEQQASKDTKARKGKTLGARGNWIPMR